MRGLVAVGTAHPMGPSLPALYQDDMFVQRMLDGLDAVLAPVMTTIDNFDAYLDPRLTPDGRTLLFGIPSGGFLAAWDVDTSKVLFQEKKYSGNLHDLAVSADGKRIAAVGAAARQARQIGRWPDRAAGESAAEHDGDGEGQRAHHSRRGARLLGPRAQVQGRRRRHRRDHAAIGGNPTAGVTGGAGHTPSTRRRAGHPAPIADDRGRQSMSLTMPPTCGQRDLF